MPRYAADGARVLRILTTLVFLSLTAYGQTDELKDDWKQQYGEIEQAIAAQKDKPVQEYLLKRMQNRNALVLPTDGSPLDVVARRTEALLNNLLENGRSATLEGYGRQLADLRAEVAAANQADRSAGPHPKGDFDLFMKAIALNRAIAFANPLLKGLDSILFVERGLLSTSPDETTGNYFVSQYLGHNAGRGGSLYILADAFSAMPSRVDILQESLVTNGPMKGKTLAGGAFISPDLSFDGKQVAFAWTPGAETSTRYDPATRFRIFTVNIDGSDLIQITGLAGDSDADDFDPCWLPGDERIVFISTRRGGYGRCQNATGQPTYVMCSMKADGTDLFSIDWHETNEWHPSVANDGTLLYTRWDYVDRHWSIAHHLWNCFPDGRNPRSWHGNYPEAGNGGINQARWDGETRPYAEYNCRSIPGSHLVVAMSGPHHGQAFGELVTIDPRTPDDDMGAQVRKITNTHPLFIDQTGKWGTPWPLSESYYLANFQRGIYLLDAFGNRQLLYQCKIRPSEDLRNMWRALDPIPVAPRKLSNGDDYPRIPPGTFQGERRGLPDHKPATIFVHNVYNSKYPLPQGVRAKWMRIVQVLAKTDPQADRPRIGYVGMMPSRIPLGVVPVEEDGSVYCEAPVGKAIFFQLLDSQGMAIQWMRSDTYVHPGEQMGCLGCHEEKWKTPLARPYSPLAAQRPPSKIQPEVSHGVMPFTYSRAVKPIFDAKCVSCHAKKGQGKAPDMSFESLDPYVYHLEKWPPKYSWHGSPDPSRTLPNTFGARLSPLTKYLTDHYGVEINPDEFRRITLWLDIGGPRFSAYEQEVEQRAGKLVWPSLDVDPSNPLGIEVLGRDETPPSSITELTADSGAYGTLTGVRLEWQASVDNESGLGRYEIYRNDETEPLDIALKTTFLDHTVQPGTKYRYRIVPVNRLGLRGPESVIVVDVTANTKLADNIALASQ